MNEWQFKRHLNEKSNRDGRYTYMHLMHLIDSCDTGNLIIQKSKTSRIKATKKIIKKNLDLILSKTPPGHIFNIIDLLLDDREMSQIFQENIDLLLQKVTEIGDKHVALLLYKSSNMIKKIRKQFGTEFVEAHIDNILHSIPLKNLVYEMNSLQGISTIVDEKLSEYIQSNLIEFIRGILDTDKIPEIRSKDELIRRYENTVLELMKEIIPKKTVIEGDKTIEIEQWNEIEKINKKSSYSDVYIVGDRVIKIGDVRATYKIPNHTRILQPIARFEMFLDDDNTIPIGCIEVSNKVRKLRREDYNEEKLYRLYWELREDGIVFTDYRLSNVGILCSNNTPVHRINGQKIKVSPETVGFMGEMKGRPCKEGDLVILDTDFLFRQEDLFKDGLFTEEQLQEEEWQEKGYSKDFERRWQQEKQAEIARKHLEQKDDSKGTSKKQKGKGDK